MRMGSSIVGQMTTTMATGKKLERTSAADKNERACLSLSLSPAVNSNRNEISTRNEPRRARAAEVVN